MLARIFFWWGVCLWKKNSFSIILIIIKVIPIHCTKFREEKLQKLGGKKSRRKSRSPVISSSCDNPSKHYGLYFIYAYICA